YPRPSILAPPISLHSGQVTFPFPWQEWHVTRTRRPFCPRSPVMPYLSGMSNCTLVLGILSILACLAKEFLNSLDDGGRTGFLTLLPSRGEKFWKSLEREAGAFGNRSSP